MTRLIRFAALLLGAMAGAAQAELEIRITRGVEKPIPIAIVPFAEPVAGRGVAVPDQVADVVASDLERSGRFQQLPLRDLVARPTSANEVDFRDWRLLNQDYLLIGRTRSDAGGGYEVEFRLFDVLRGEQMVGARIPAAAQDMRATAHQISDWIYEKIIGEKGAFSTRIAYVTKKGAGKSTRYTLQIADVDGYNPQTIMRSKEPIMSPAWSPDGEKLAYVSFEGGRSAIYLQEVYSGRRDKLASYKGINGAPNFSPDGSKLALTLSKGNNPDIYLMDLDSKKISRLTRHYAIDTEPVWAPDGKQILFTSDRGGKPQLYLMDTEGGAKRRVTFSGDYNARGRFSPDGKRIAMVTGTAGRYRIAVQELDSGRSEVLTDGKLDESPSFAPNSSMLIYATKERGRGVLAAASVDGRVQQSLALQAGEVQEPVWGPYLNF